jgi:hypothetical protein
MAMEEHLCAHCASSQIVRTRQATFTVVSHCLHCQRRITRPLVSVVLVDAADARREQLVSLLRAEGIPVVPVSRVASLERWPVGEVVVTDIAHSTRWWSEVGATHVIVLVDSDAERQVAEGAGVFATATSRDPRTVLALLRTIADGSGPPLASAIQ